MNANRHSTDDFSSMSRGSTGPSTHSSMLSLMEKAGQEDAYFELLRRIASDYYGFIFSRLKKMGLQDADAQDLFQELSFHISTQIKRQKYLKIEGKKFRSWLTSVVTNFVRSWLKSRRDKPVLDPTVIDALGSQLSPPAEFWPTREGLKTVLGSIADWHWKMVRELLTIVEFKCLYLSAVDGISSAEIGKMLGVSPDYVRQLKKRAIAKIRNHVREHGTFE